MGEDEIVVRLPPALRDALVQALTNALVRQLRAETQHPALDRLAYRPAEAASLLGVSRSVIYEMIARGELGHVKVGRSVRIPADALRAVLSSRSE